MDGQQVPLAGWWRRLGAFLVDALLVGMVVGVSLLAVWLSGSWDSFPIAMVVGAASALLLVLWLLTFRLGRTPGKAALGIVAVDVATAETLGWGRMFLRELAAKGLVAGLLATLFLDGSVATGLRVALISPWIVSVLWPLWDKNKQTLHDKAVGTTIVREKMDGQQVPLAVWSRRLGAFLVDVLLAGPSVGVSLLAVWLSGSWIAFPITMVVGGPVLSLLLYLGWSLAGGEFLDLSDLSDLNPPGYFLVFTVAAPACWVLWLLTLGQGQTPGKAALGIVAVDVATGETLGWGRMFLREIAAKGLVSGLLATLFIDGSVVTWLRVALIALWIVSVMWPLWDKNKQTLHDKMVGTTIVCEKEDTPKS